MAVLFCFALCPGPTVCAADAFARQSVPADKPLWNAAWLTDTQSSEMAYIAALIEAVRADLSAVGQNRPPAVTSKPAMLSKA